MFFRWVGKGLSILTSFIFFASLFLSCSDDDSSSTGGVVRYERALSGDSVIVSPLSAPYVIKNLIKDYNKSGDTYYEYLTFRSDTGGGYAIYKSSPRGLEKQTTISNGGVDSTIPTSFTYDRAKLCVTLSDLNVATYLFLSGGRILTAAEKLSPSGDETSPANGDTSSKLFDTWSAKGAQYVFTIKDDGLITIKIGVNTQVLKYGNYDGLIESLDSRAGSNVFFFGKVGSDESLFWRVNYAESVSGEGRAATLDANFVSSDFLFLR